MTSRTLCHWEEKGLFQSHRDPQSGWRVYNNEALQRIRIIKLLRQLDIPLKLVKAILDSTDPQIAARIIINQINKLNEENIVIVQQKDFLSKCLLGLNSMEPIADTSGYLEEKRIPGGLYAALNSTNEVYDSWQALMRLLKENNEYVVDESRSCLEECIPSGEDKGEGNDFYLNLLEPISKK